MKMVHNGIEYGLMQAYAEGFELMKAIELYDLDLAQIAALWQHGSVVRSWLLELLHRAFVADPGLERIRGLRRRTRARAAGPSTRRSTRPCRCRPSRRALFARFASRQDDSFAAKVNAALRNQFGGHAVEAAQSAEEGSRPDDRGRGRREPARRGPAHAAAAGAVRADRSSAPRAT